MMNENTNYYVEAHSKLGSFSNEITAKDLNELAQFVRETFAYMNGCNDTSDIDCSWIKFTYDSVEDEDGNDITDEAQKYI